MAAGSWYWDSSGAHLYVWLPDSSSPTGHTIEAATRLYGIEVIANGGEKSNLVIDNLNIQRVGGGGIYFYSNDQNNQGLTGIAVRNNTVSQTGTGLVDDGSYYNGIHYSQHAELPTAPLFENNKMSYTGNHGNGINCQNADNAQILNNHADHFNHHGFDTKYSANVLIKGNVAHDGAFGTNGIYQENSANGLIEDNIVYNLSSNVGGKGSGIQIDAGTSGAQVYNNSIDSVYTGIYATTRITAKNNIVVGASSAALEANQGGTFDYNDWGPNAQIDYNQTFYNFSQWQAQAGHSHDMSADPKWTNAPSNFSLTQTSPCINAGTNVGMSYNGSVPDMGAIESPY